MEALLVSTGAVALAEIGDKTQLLALVLAARFRAPIAIGLGIFAATVLNHTLAAWVGVLASDWLSPDVLRWILAASFFAMALWTLVPDKLDSQPEVSRKLGAFATTLIAFFIVEMGDKTQIATVALAAKYNAIVAVAVGTTIGMMLANLPVVFLGGMAGTRVPLKQVRRVAAAIFFGLGIAAIVL